MSHEKTNKQTISKNTVDETQQTHNINKHQKRV
jgi:hypothetical protein